MRVALLRPIDARALAVGPSAVAALVAFTLLASIAGDAALQPPPRRFDLAGLERESLWILCALGLAWLLAREVGREALLRPLFAALLAVRVLAALLELAGGLLLGLQGEPTTTALAWVRALAWLWQIAVVGQVAALGSGLGALRGGALACVYVAVVWGLAAALPSDGRFWTPDWEKVAAEREQEETPALVAEDVLRVQAERIATAAAALAPQRPGIADLYFVAFAADASQAVFRREVEYARRLFDERFDTAGRSLVLVNHADTVETEPLASASNLRDALVRVGAVMDRDEDVLFLFLTGHGSRERGLAVSFDPLPLNDVEPQPLHAMIEEAGIRWRVAVVSACYSGVFLEPLRADESLVMTAASADRRSFGCSNEADFTYFGRAYFAEALHEVFSFPRAFEIARARVEEREAAEKKEHSLPQMAIGAAIRAKLAEVEGRLGNDPGPRTLHARF